MKPSLSYQAERLFCILVLFASMAAAFAIGCFGKVFTASDPGFIGALSTTVIAPPQSNLEIWLRASDGVTVDAGVITNWASMVNSHNFTNRASARMPTVVSSGLNSLDTVQFDGTDQLSSSTSPSITQPSTIYIVCKSETANVNGDSPFDGRTISTMRFRQTGSADGFALAAGGGPTTATTNLIGVWYYNMLIFNHPSSQTIATTNNGFPFTGATAGSTSATGWTIGSAGETTSGGWEGEIAEILVYKKLHDSTEQSTTKTYLKNRYALP